MTEAHSSAERTKTKILRAARELFAERGIRYVSVRDIATQAGVNHALVHRYFGAKEDVVAEIIRREVEAAGLSAPPYGKTPEESLGGLRRMLHFGMTDAGTTIKLVTRAELAGLEPEKMLHGEPQLLGALAEWIRHEQGKAESAAGAAGDLPDPALAAAVIGASIFSFVTLSPWIMTAVGLTPEDIETRRDEIVEILCRIAASAAGLDVRPPSPDPGEA